MSHSPEQLRRHHGRRSRRAIGLKADQEMFSPAEFPRCDRHGRRRVEGAEFTGVPRAEHFRRADDNVAAQVADRQLAHVLVEHLQRRVLNRHPQPEPAGRHVEHHPRRRRCRVVNGGRAGRRDRAFEQHGTVG